MVTNSRIENLEANVMMETENLEEIVMMEIVVMETNNLEVIVMSNLVIVKGVIVRVAINLMTRKDSMIENQVTLFHQEIGSNCLRNFQHPIQTLLTLKTSLI